MSEQMRLSLPVRAALGREDFIIAPSNALALAMIDTWQNWPLGKMVLSGPESAGKTHLTHVWATDSGARIVAATSLEQADIAELASGPVAIEDLPAIAADLDAQTQMFHLHNLLLANGHALLMTGTPPPGHWRLSLPDLQSRIDAAGHAILQPPDDDLLSVVLWKLFADRGLRPRDDVIPYLVKRIERSFSAARDIVRTIDDRSLDEKREVTRKFASETLDNLAK